MIVRVTRLTCMSALLAVLGSTQALAGPDAEFEARTKRAVELSNAVTAVERGFGEFTGARSTFTRGDQSVSSRVLNWQRRSVDWVGGWFEVFALSDLENPVEFAGFERKLDELVTKQHDELEALRREADHLERELVKTKRLFRETRLPGNSKALQTYIGVFEAFQKIQKKANTEIGGLSGLLTGRIARLKEVNRVSHKVILAHLESALLDKHLYPLQESIQRISTLLKDKELVDPIINRLTNAEAKASDLGLNLHLFELEALAQESKEACERATATLNEVENASSQIKRAKERVVELCASIQEHNTFLQTLGMEDSELVYELVNVEKYELEALCVNSEDPGQECEKLAVLAAFEMKDLEQMSREELRFVETEWTDNLRAVKEQ